MALASQTTRLNERARVRLGAPTGAAHRRLRPGPMILGVAVLAGLATLGWFWLGRSENANATRTAAASDPLDATFSTLASGADASRTGAQPQAAPTTPKQTPPQAQPISVIDMSKGVQKDPAATAESATAPGAGSTPAAPSPHQPAGAQPVQPSPNTTGAAPASAPPASSPTTTANPAAHTPPALAEADRLIATNRLVEARSILNTALAAATPDAAPAIRDRLGAINQTLVFSPTVIAGDPIALSYAVQPGDSLAKITATQGLQVDWRLLQRVNGMANPSRLNVGQKLKLVRGPFHAVVSKSNYRLDLYWGDTSSSGERTFIRSFRVGLGENNSTPVGAFVVRPSSKLINPEWVNPRTGERFAADNPLNPIGERWIGLDPADASTAVHTQYGLHGTIEPDSIGQQKSMGCVRLAPDDIALIYELLADRVSTVTIDP